MSIDTQALREAAEKTIQEEGETWWNEEQLASDYGLALHKADAKFIAAANPATVIALLDELEAAEKELSACKSILEKIKSTSCHVDTSKGASIPNSLDAWGRPVPQYLPYDFSGNPGASATQYCNGWNDAGGYWLNHVKYLQECITAAGIITKVGGVGIWLNLRKSS